MERREAQAREQGQYCDAGTELKAKTIRGLLLPPELLKEYRQHPLTASAEAPEKVQGNMIDDPKTQRKKSEQAARELECDESEARFEERVRKLVQHKPVEKPE